MMGQVGAQAFEIAVESGWWSKINWTQAVAWVCSGLSIWTAGKFDVDPATQVYIVLTIQGLAGMLTVWLRQRSTTITPTAAEQLKQKPAA